MTDGSNGAFGRILSAHRGTLSAGGWFWYIGLLAFAGGFICLAQRAGISLPSRSGPATAPPSLLTIGLGFLFGLAILIMPVLRWRQRVEVFEGGFVWSRLTGSVSVGRVEVRSAELIQHYTRAGSYAEVVVHLGDDRELSMRGLAQADQLANLLRAFAAPAVRAAVAPETTRWTAPISRFP